jgi:hypothetical protein
MCAEVPTAIAFMTIILARGQSIPPARRATASLVRRFIMLYTIAIILLVLWLLGLVTSFTAGGLLHLLLVVAVVMVIYQLITGRRVG